MKFQTKPLSVLETTSHYLKSGAISKAPAWYNVVGANPPFKNHIKRPTHLQKSLVAQQEAILDTPEEAEAKKNSSKFTFNSKTGMYRTRINKLKSPDFYKPVKLKFLEDELRALFYDQHPWELADAKVLVEGTSVKSADSYDWSNIVQLGKVLDGESVVQRTLYLLKTSKKNGSKLLLEQAYNQARSEYYRVKMARETEVQVAKEEGIFSGAVYGKSHIEEGFENENKVLAKWREDGIRETKLMGGM